MKQNQEQSPLESTSNYSEEEGGQCKEDKRLHSKNKPGEDIFSSMKHNENEMVFVSVIFRNLLLDEPNLFLYDKTPS